MLVLKDWKIVFFSAFASCCHRLSKVSAEGPPRKLALADHERITFAETNQSTILKCPIEMTEHQTFVDWFRGNMSLYMEKGYELTGKGFLKIKSVTKKDSGEYTCEGINGHGSVRVNITLIVDNPEVEDTNNTPANTNSASRVNGLAPLIKKRVSTHFVDDVGGQATFHCVASGQPTPHIFWLKDGHLVEAAENEVSKGRAHSTLKLRGLKKSRAGVYKCIARNKNGESHMDFFLSVTDPSSPPRIVALEPPNVTIKEGATAVFWCEVDSRPGLKLHIKWLKKVFKQEIEHSTLSNDMTLFRSGSTYFRPVNLSDGGTTATDGVYKSKLLIRNSEKADSGTYVCLALNDKGFNFKNVTLTVIGTAKTVPNPSSYLANTSTSLIVIVIIAFVTVLSAIVLVSHLYCRGKSSQKKNLASTAMVNDVEAGNSIQNATSVRKPTKKDFIPYIEVNDPYSASKLLCKDTNHLYNHNEDQASRISLVQSYVH